jgi:hypothetical protein
VSDVVASLSFPFKGVDVSQDVSGQPPLTCVVGINVQTYEPSSNRGRGGSRPGMSRLPQGQVPTGFGLVQHLNTVITTDAANVPTGIEDPTNPVIDDWSSPGGPELWGTAPLYLDPVTGAPVTGATLGTRIPGHPRRRKEGSGYQPNPNQLTQAPPPGAKRGCFQGQIVYVITNPPPDIGGWNGQSPSEVGIGCLPYAPLVGYTAPGTAALIPKGVANPTLGTPADMAILDYIRVWLAHYVGSNCYGTVTSDLITDPSTVVSGGCTNLPCSAAPPTYVPTGPIVGTKIFPA